MNSYAYSDTKPRGHYLITLGIAALGIVYGDIGTSPLYAIRECFSGEHGVSLTHDNILGLLSLIVWSLTIIISIKYLLYVMRADNRGEGGILALMALATTTGKGGRTTKGTIILLGLFGAALLYGDGMITPAISALSAVEGLKVAAPSLQSYVVTITICILIGLFFFQKRGTAKVGAVFGPVTLVWFVILTVLGLSHIVRQPQHRCTFLAWRYSDSTYSAHHVFLGPGDRARGRTLRHDSLARTLICCHDAQRVMCNDVFQRAHGSCNGSGRTDRTLARSIRRSDSTVGKVGVLSAHIPSVVRKCYLTLSSDNNRVLELL